MNQRSKTILINIFSCVVIAVVIAGIMVYFQHRQFHWWSLLPPAISIPLIIVASRRQKYWDDLRRKRQLNDANRAKQEPSN